MRIDGWEIVVDETGQSRGASHPVRGSMVWLNGRLIGHGDVPPEVVEWLIRPALRSAWSKGCVAASAVKPVENPFDGEPPSKDHEPS